MQGEALIFIGILLAALSINIVILISSMGVCDKIDELITFIKDENEDL